MRFEFEVDTGLVESCKAPWLSSKTGKHGILLPGIMKRQTCLKNNNTFTASPRATYSASEVERVSHAHSSVLKATAQQHGIQLVGELAPCSGCSMAKGIRASTPHRTTSRAEAPLDLVHIPTEGPFPESLGGSRYVVVFVDSASRFQRIRDTGQERIGHPRSGATVRC